MDAIESKIRETVAAVTGLAYDVDADADLYLDLGVASAHALALLSELEAQFGIVVPDDDFVAATSLNALTVLVRELVQEKEGSSSRA